MTIKREHQLGSSKACLHMFFVLAVDLLEISETVPNRIRVRAPKIHGAALFLPTPKNSATSLKNTWCVDLTELWIEFGLPNVYS